MHVSQDLLRKILKCFWILGWTKQGPISFVDRENWVDRRSWADLADQRVSAGHGPFADRLISSSSTRALTGRTVGERERVWVPLRRYSVPPVLSSHLRLLWAGPGFRSNRLPSAGQTDVESLSELPTAARFSPPLAYSLACYSGTGKNKIIAVHESGCSLYQWNDSSSLWGCLLPENAKFLKFLVKLNLTAYAWSNKYKLKNN